MRALIEWYERRWHGPRTKAYNAKHRRYAVHHGAGAVTTKQPPQNDQMAA